MTALVLVAVLLSGCLVTGCTDGPRVQRETVLGTVTIRVSGRSGIASLTQIRPDGIVVVRSTRPGAPVLSGGRLDAGTMASLTTMLTSDDLAEEALRDHDSSQCPTDGETLALTMGALRVGTYLPCGEDLPSLGEVLALVGTASGAAGRVALPAGVAPLAPTTLTKPVGPQGSSQRGYTLDVAADGTVVLVRSPTDRRTEQLEVTEVNGLRLLLESLPGPVARPPVTGATGDERCRRLVVTSGGRVLDACDGLLPSAGDVLEALVDDHFDL